jgi:hypothetical protein
MTYAEISSIDPSTNSDGVPSPSCGIELDIKRLIAAQYGVQYAHRRRGELVRRSVHLMVFLSLLLRDFAKGCRYCGFHIDTIKATKFTSATMSFLKGSVADEPLWYTKVINERLDRIGMWPLLFQG